MGSSRDAQPAGPRDRPVPRARARRRRPPPERARALLRPGGRALLGIAGPPGSGKSTLAARLVSALGEVAALVPMDGFHLAQAELARLGRAARKGAPDTFDAAGYLSLLARLVAPAGPSEEVVYAPAFDRHLEEPIVGSIPIGPNARLVVTEGNYLLEPSPPWGGLAELLGETWYLEVPEPLRRARLVARHEAHGRTPAEARRWALGSDEINAERVRSSRDRADLVVRLGSGEG